MGYSPQQILGQHHRMFCIGSYASTSEYTRFWQELRNGHPHSGTFERKKADGESIWLEAIYIPIRNSLNRVTSIFKIASDVTTKWTN